MIKENSKLIILDIEGKKAKEISLPEFFSYDVRDDIVSKVLESKKNFQPYGPSPVAGKKHSASGKIRHARRKWRTAYGMGISRVPRKIMIERGSRFIWVGAEIASTRGGRRAHPPKVVKMLNRKKINKKEMKIALFSALSSTAKKNFIKEKYNSLSEEDLKGLSLPLILETKITSLKIKELLSVLKKILGDKLFKIALKNKKIRAGKGKIRGRRYKKSAGLLFVIGNKENFSTKLFDIKKVKDLGVNDLASGGLGRLVIYTEEAIKDLQEKFKEKIGEKKK